MALVGTAFGALKLNPTSTLTKALLQTQEKPILNPAQAFENPFLFEDQDSEILQEAREIRADLQSIAAEVEERRKIATRPISDSKWASLIEQNECYREVKSLFENPREANAFFRKLGARTSGELFDEVLLPMEGEIEESVLDAGAVEQAAEEELAEVNALILETEEYLDRFEEVDDSELKESVEAEVKDDFAHYRWDPEEPDEEEHH